MRQGDTGALAETLKMIKLKKSKADGIASATADKIQFLQQRIANLDKESTKLKNGKTQAVRFPRERTAKSSPLPIIVRYGSIYPLGIGATFEANPSIDRTPNSDHDGFRAEPIRGRGISAPFTDEVLAATLKAAGTKGMYATIYLYQDSHHVFGVLKEALSDAGVSYGLEFVGSNKSLSFSSEGTAPPEL